MSRLEGITKVVGLVGALGLVGACGDNAAPDARIEQPPIDVGVPTIDADTTPDAPGAPDASIDATAAPSYSATISIQEVSVNGVPQVGQGLQITASFNQNGAVGTLLFDEMPGSPLGCEVTEYTAAEAAADVGLDEGALTITSTDGDPIIPTCTFIPTRGYMCIGGAGAGGTISAGPMAGLWVFTDTEVMNSAEQVGRYISISGAVNAGNNGAFPVVAAAGANSLVFASANPATMAETLPGAATFTLVAGAGPIPGAVSPGFLEDDDIIQVDLAPGGGNHFDPISETFPATVAGVGDEFTLDTASQMTISQIPTDGSAFTIGCDGAGGSCNTAFGSVMTITTTDGDVTGLSPLTMPLPTTIRRVIRCAAIGATHVDVSDTVSAFIQSSGATRIQVAFLRDGLQQGANSVSTTVATWNVVAGHGVIGFTTP
jgi:hypothetical protein